MSTRDDRLIWSGPVKIVDALGLEAATMEGWALLQVIRVDRVEYVSSSMVNPHKKESYDSDTLGLGSSAVAQDVTFLVGKTEETALADAIQKEADARAIAKRHMGEHSELEKAFAELKSKSERYQDDHKRSNNLYKMQCEAYNKKRDALQILEGDMSKVIARIGQREWDAAVSTEGAA